MPPGTMLISIRPPVMLSSVPAICAKRPGAMNPGLTAMRNRMSEVTAANAVAVVHVSARGASCVEEPVGEPCRYQLRVVALRLGG